MLKPDDLRAMHEKIHADLLREGNLRRLPRTRPRDPEKEAILLELACRHVAQCRQRGLLVPTGPNRWRLDTELLRKIELGE